MTDVGDAVALTYKTTTGATVVATVVSPGGTSNDTPVTEDLSNSGAYPFTFVATSPGAWHAIFTASGTVTAVDDYWIVAEPLPTRPPLATIDDVIEMFGPLSDAQAAITPGLLRRASAMLRGSAADLDGRIASGAVDRINANTAVVQMVLRVLRNPRGVVQQTIGPFSVTFDRASAAAQLAVTPADLALLTTTGGAAATAPAGTIRIRPGFDRQAWGRHVPRY